MAAYLLMLREGVEAALIVGILLAYVRRMNRRSEARWIWVGTLAAAFLSVLAGMVIYSTIGSLDERAEEMVEGVIAWIAAGLLTWMIFWMGSRARAIRQHLEAEVDEALSAGGSALAAIAFVAVLREGLESALFLISATVGADSGAGQFLGGTLGLVTAVVIGYAIYRGGSRIDIGLFFKVTGALIILFAAGLVAKGVHEFQEVGLLPTILDPLWNLNVLDPDTNVVGEFAKSLFGWRPDPSLLMVISYLAYLLPIGAAFWNLTSRGGSRTEAEVADEDRTPVA